LGVLGRIDRLDVPAIETRPPRVKRVGPSIGAPGRNRERRRLRRVAMWMAAIGFIVPLGAAGWWAWTTDAWLPRATAAVTPPRPVVLPASPEPVPAAAASEAYVTRAEALFAAGRLRDALIEVEHVPIGDPLRAEADR